MFSLLPIGELTLDEAGTASIEFPSDLPGDKDGNITIIARFEENPTFGNVEKSETHEMGFTYRLFSTCNSQGSLDKNCTQVDDLYFVNSSCRCLGTLSLCSYQSYKNKD